MNPVSVLQTCFKTFFLFFCLFDFVSHVTKFNKTCAATLLTQFFAPAAHSICDTLQKTPTLGLKLTKKMKKMDTRSNFAFSHELGLILTLILAHVEQELLNFSTILFPMQSSISVIFAQLSRWYNFRPKC